MLACDMLHLTAGVRCLMALQQAARPTGGWCSAALSAWTAKGPAVGAAAHHLGRGGHDMGRQLAASLQAQVNDSAMDKAQQISAEGLLSGMAGC